MKKIVYCLRIRPDDKDSWSEATYYTTRKERDHAERINRIIGGMRTFGYQEKKTAEEIEELTSR